MELLSNFLQRNIGYLENFDDSRITKVIRLEAIKWACTIGDGYCKNLATMKLSRHLADRELYKFPLGHNFMYCIGLMAANRTTWDKMLELYQKTDPKNLKFRRTLLNSLSCIENPDIIINYLNLATYNTSLFNEEDHSLIFMSVINKHSNDDLILDYILNNFEALKPKSLTTTAIIKYILWNNFYNEQIDKIKMFSDVNLIHDQEARGVIDTLIQKRKSLVEKNLKTFKKYYF